jgi:hypothetical protein
MKRLLILLSIALLLLQSHTVFSAGFVSALRGFILLP